MCCSQTSALVTIYRLLELAKQAVEHRPGLKVLYTTGQTLTDGMRELFVSGSAFPKKPYTVGRAMMTLSGVL